MVKPFYLALAGLLTFSLTGFGFNMDKFDWLATDSAPEIYPMKIIRGDFTLSNEGSMYIPDTRTLHKGWGTGESVHVVGPELKPLAKAMEITFFSITENQFYQGNFDLPYDRILELFSKGYYSPRKKGETTYDTIMTGVAPGGVVAVWLRGTDRVTEVFYGKAEAVDLPWTTFIDNPDFSREEILRLELEENLKPEQMEKLEREGVVLGKWDRYRETYPWRPVISSARLPGLINMVSYFNGELDYLRYPLEQSIAEQSRPVPQDVSFIWRDSAGGSYWLDFDFDEAEIFDAFERLAPQSETQSGLELELRIEELAQGRKIDALLRNNNEVIELKQTRLDVKPTGLSDEQIDELSNW